jgi:serpin B
MGTFTTADGSSVQTPLMRNSMVQGALGMGAGYQVVEIPYAGGATSMVVILPDAGQLAAVEAQLSGAFFRAAIASLVNGALDLTMPKFSIHGATVSLSQELQKLGMTDAFGASADFSAMLTMPPVPFFLSDVLQQAFVSVDEAGTEAAAATAVIGDTAAAEPPGTVVSIDRPFFFVLRDKSTETLLFVGREMDPTH